MRAISPARSRSACWASSRALASRSSRSASAPLAASCSASRPSSPASRPATCVSSEVKSRCARSARATASSRAEVSRPISSSAAAARDLSAFTWPCSRARPSRRSAAARCRPGDPAVLGRGGVLGRLAGGHRPLERGAVLLDLRGDLRPPAPRARSASASSWSGSRPDRAVVVLGGAGGVAHPLGGQRLRAAQPLAQAGQREPGLLRRGQLGQVLAQGGLEGGLALARAGDRAPRRPPAARPARTRRPAPAPARCGRSTRSSATSRARASRTSACTVCARRATSAWRPSGLSWRRISLSRSLSRVRLPSVESSLRSAFSLRLRCLRTPAASSMKPRRSSGVACRICVELALPDDHVHLAADAGVAEQLLHVEQAAGAAVDGVLRAAGAEHGAADRDLGVLDRQRAVGVVDGQQHLGATQRRAARRCRRR